MFCIAFGIERPPLCVNYLTMCQLFDGIYENANVGDGRPASRLVKSSPPALFYFILTPPLTLEATEYAGCEGFKDKCQLFDVIASH